ncbi:hypothetical protein MMC25_001576 [Agyrium rufum]|nr:hypothetical protein [Agyrium rufum]
MATNPLISTARSDSTLQVLLHPLVPLTISDYITRHTLRRQTSLIAGTILGQQNGREITFEHAFEIKLAPNGSSIDYTWFQERLNQYLAVHKDPQLQLVGWFTTAPTAGPQEGHLGIHRALMAFMDPSLLLAFHPASVLEGDVVGGKLPLTIYEGITEGGDALPAESDISVMQIEGQDNVGAASVKFREIPYAVETGEAEMIGVDFVARGGGNATAVDGITTQTSKKPVTNGDSAAGQSVASQPNGMTDTSLLSPEDEELLAALTTRTNAVKMLHSRIQLFKTYLSNLPPCYLNQESPSSTSSQPQNSSTSTPTPSTTTEINFPLLRSINALASHLPIVIPADSNAYQDESLAEKSDVSLVSLLGSIGKSAGAMKTLGSKYAIVESVKKDKAAKTLGGGRGFDGFPGMGEGMGWDGSQLAEGGIM